MSSVQYKQTVLWQVVFSFVLVVYIVLVAMTVSAVREVPLKNLSDFAVEEDDCKFTDDHIHSSGKCADLCKLNLVFKVV